MVVRRRNRLADFWIPNHDIRIGPFDDGPFARVDVQDLRHVGRGRRDEFIGCQPARLDAFGPEHRQTLFQPVRPVGDDAEIVLARAFLLGRERGVVRRNHLQRSRLQARPKAVLMVLGPERRRHDTARGMVPIFVEIFAFVQSQELDQWLAIDPHPLLPRTADRLVGLLARDMHDIKRHAGGICDGDRAVRGFAFQLGRTGIGVTLRPRDPLIKILLLQGRDQIAVFGMHHRQRTQFGTTLEGREHLVILDHQGPFIGHKVFERIHPHVDGVFHLVKDILVPTGDRHVIADIRTDLRCGFAMPFIDRVLDRPIRTRQTEIHNHRGPAHSRGPSPRLEGFGRRGPHKRHLEVGVRINTPGNDIGPFGVDIFVAHQILADLLDDLALDQHIRFPGPIRRADHAALDNLAHLFSPLSVFQMVQIPGVWGLAPRARPLRPPTGSAHNLCRFQHRMQQNIGTRFGPVFGDLFGLVMA